MAGLLKAFRRPSGADLAMANTVRNRLLPFLPMVCMGFGEGCGSVMGWFGSGLECLGRLYLQSRGPSGGRSGGLRREAAGLDRGAEGKPSP